MDGHGTYIWRHGTIYRGQWRAGLMHGCGVKLSRSAKPSDFDVQEGKWFGDEYVGPIMECR